MKKQEFEIEKQQFEQLMLIDDDNLLDMSREKPYLQAKYINKFNKELEIYNDICSKYDKKYGELFKELKFNSKYVWKNKDEIESQMFLDDSFYEIKKDRDFQKLVIDYFQMAIDTVKSIGYDLKTYTEYKMFLMGK